VRATRGSWTAAGRSYPNRQHRHVACPNRARATVTGIIGKHCGFSALVHSWGMTVVCRSWIDAGFKKGVLMKKFLLAAIGLCAALSLSACAGKDPVFIGKGKGPPPAAPPIVRKG
jgi:hypothetical protein